MELQFGLVAALGDRAKHGCCDCAANGKQYGKQNQQTNTREPHVIQFRKTSSKRCFDSMTLTLATGAKSSRRYQSCRSSFERGLESARSLRQPYRVRPPGL